MFSDYPRKVGKPEQFTVWTEEQMLECINQNCGYTNLYTAVFSEEQKTFGTLDKVFFDFDICDGLCEDCKPQKKAKCSMHEFDFEPRSKNAFQNVLDIHNYFLEMDIAHVIGCSGGGYHVYGKAINIPLKNPNSALKGWSKETVQDLKLLCDSSVFEMHRIMRYPNTFNINKGKWFFWLNQEDLDSGHDSVMEKANQQRIAKPFIWGTKKIDLRPFDIETNNINVFQEIGDIAKVTKKNVAVLPCISNMMKDPYLPYNLRYLVILFFKEKGMGISTVVEVLQEFLSGDRLKHCVLEERQPKHIFGNDNLFFPKCSTLKREGHCPIEGKCPNADKIYLGR